MNEFFDRYTKLLIKSPSSGKEILITSDELTIYFSTHRHDTASSSKSYGAMEDNTIIAEIGIFNLSEDTKELIEYENTRKKTGGSTVTLISGYKDNHGVIFTGLVASMETRGVDADSITILHCRESKAIVQNAVVNVTYTGGRTLSKLVEDLANEAEIPIGRIDPKNIVGKSRTYAPLQSLDEIFTELAIECEFRYEFLHGALYFLDPTNTERELYVLTPSTGLLSAYLEYDPVWVNDSYDVTTLLIPNIRWMGAVKIGDYVCSVTKKPIHISNGENHCTKFLATVCEEVV
jgi:hypothetical protein